LPPEQRHLDAVEDVLTWLEDSLRETRGQMLRLEQNVQTTESTLSDLTSKVHAVEDGSAAVSRRLGELNAFAVQVQQIQQYVTSIHETIRESERRVGEALRVQQQESERQRLELNDAVRQIELLQRVVEGWGSRFENVETTIGRVQESLTLNRQRTEELDRRHEATEINASRVAEAFRRYEHLAGRLEVDLEKLQKTQVQTGDRMQAFAETMKRFEEQNDAVAAEVSAQRDIFERIDLLRAELHRLEDRIGGTETERDLDRQEIEDHQRLISLLDGKDRGFADRLAMLQGELAAYRELVSEQFNRLHLTLDRQKRHQIEELQRELRDLQVHAFRPPEELAAQDDAKPPA
jgi:chromosome segregation ATPase